MTHSHNSFEKKEDKENNEGKEEEKDNAWSLLPRGIPAIIQSYLSDDHVETGNTPFLTRSKIYGCDNLPLADGFSIEYHDLEEDLRNRYDHFSTHIIVRKQDQRLDTEKKSTLHLPLSRVTLFGNPNFALADMLSYQILWHGNPDSIAAVITKENPELFLEKVERVDPQGKIQRGTLYQLLLQVDNNCIRNQHGETLLQMFRRVLLSIPNGKDIEEKQRVAWFADWDEQAHVTELKAEFDKVTRVFDETAPTSDTELQTAVEQFKKYLSEINPRKNCIPALWDYAANFYQEDKFASYCRHSAEKNLLFCQKVLGLIDRHLPAWGMLILINGLNNAVRNDKTPLHYKGDNAAYYYGVMTHCYRSSSSLPSQFELGNNCFMNNSGQCCFDGTGAASRAICDETHAFFSTLTDQSSTSSATPSAYRRTGDPYRW